MYCKVGLFIFFFLCPACNRSRMTDLSCSTTFILCYFDYVSVWGEKVGILECPYHGLQNRGKDGCLQREDIVCFPVDTGSLTFICSWATSFLWPKMTIAQDQWDYCIPLLTYLVKGKSYTWHMDIMSWVTELICISYLVISFGYWLVSTTHSCPSKHPSSPKHAFHTSNIPECAEAHQSVLKHTRVCMNQNKRHSNTLVHVTRAGVHHGSLHKVQ